MGCWYETCIVTGLPVLPGAQALMIVPKKGLHPEFTAKWWCYGDYEMFKRIELAEYGYYNDYGWITANKRDKYDKHWKKYLKEHLDDDRPDGRSIFVHKYAMERVVEMFPLKLANSKCPKVEIEWFHKTYKLPKEAEHLLSLVEVVNEFRLDPYCGYAHKGSQNRVERYEELLDIKREQHRVCREWWEKECN